MLLYDSSDKGQGVTKRQMHYILKRDYITKKRHILILERGP